MPTGVIMTVAPFAAVTLLGAAGMVTIKMRKKEDDAE
ncbi:QVPTGV class sortase B protein-sorting domain-containing protein [Segatella copri]